jgi:prepilin-type N-terminal cleavage/methylation domain-containing protein
MKKKGFTLVELLVVIAIIALLMGILMPALARVRQIAFRMVCGTNLSGIGKAMLIYANDWDDELPRAGGQSSIWGQRGRVIFDAPDRFTAYRLTSGDGEATITSCFYLLVKYAEVTPKSFICKGDTNVTEFEPGEDSAGVQYDLVELWDFGASPWRHCSYSYHQPFGTFALTTSSEPGMAVAADPNPWLVDDTPKVWADYDPITNPTREAIRYGNAMTHQDEGQNVLFLDSHVDFENTPACGINEDNIYTYQAPNKSIQWGGFPQAPGTEPEDRSDSYCVNDGTSGRKTRSCFLPNTPVRVDGAFVPISQVAVGQTAGTTNTTIVEKLQEHIGTFECRDVKLASGKCISVVETHLFMLESGVWVTSLNLKSGMKLKTMNGSIAIESVTVREMPYVGEVYNVKVSNTHQYMVGEDAVIVRDY